MDLSGRVAVVTGAGSGLGAVVSARLADRGAVVVVVDVDPDAAGRTSASLPGSVPVVTDLSRPVAVDTVAAAVAGLAPPALLVNNAGGWGTAGRQFPDAAPDEWRSVLALNLVVPMALTQRLLGPMADAGGGAVVHVASSAGRDTGAYASPEYAVAKAGLVRLTTSLAGLAASHGVRVGCVVPGWVGLERAHAERAALPPEDRPELVPPQDVADAVVALATDDTSAGRVVVLDGGWPAEVVDR